MTVPRKAPAILILGIGLVAVLISCSATAAEPYTPPFFGIAVPQDDPALLAAVTTDAGMSPTVDNVFVKLDSPNFGASQLRTMQSRGFTPMISLEPWSYKNRWGDADLAQYSLANIVAGRWDADLTRIAGAFREYGQLSYLRFAHEMNGWWYPWAAGENSNTPALYVQAWRHVVTMFRSAAGPGVKFVWSPNNVTGSPRETPLEASFPGDRWVDFVSMSAYGHGGSATETIGPTYDRLTALSQKPMILSEVGADGPQKVDWIDSFEPFLREHRRITGFVWFNTSPATTGATGDYRFTSSEASTVAFRRFLAALFV